MIFKKYFVKIRNVDVYLSVVVCIKLFTYVCTYNKLLLGPFYVICKLDFLK
jgi:hypothetical protein